MKNVVLILSFFTLSFNTFAHGNSKEEKIHELVNVMDMDSMMKGIYAQMEAMMKNTSQQLEIKPSEQPIYDRYYQRMTQVMEKKMGWAQMEPMVIATYTKHFNEKEIDEMLTFYQSEVGQTILAKMPMVMQETMMLSQQLLQNALPQIEMVSTQLQTELAQARQQSED